MILGAPDPKDRGINTNMVVIHACIDKQYIYEYTDRHMDTNPLALSTESLVAATLYYQ